MNILEQAAEIVYVRSGEKEQQYGPFIECMEKTARIASELSGKLITVEDAYNVVIAMKLARESHTHKEDNLLDVVAYLSSLNDYKNGDK